MCFAFNRWYRLFNGGDDNVKRLMGLGNNLASVKLSIQVTGIGESTLERHIFPDKN